MYLLRTVAGFFSFTCNTLVSVCFDLALRFSIIKIALVVNGYYIKSVINIFVFVNNHAYSTAVTRLRAVI